MHELLKIHGTQSPYKRWIFFLAMESKKSQKNGTPEQTVLRPIHVCRYMKIRIIIIK